MTSVLAREGATAFERKPVAAHFFLDKCSSEATEVSSVGRQQATFVDHTTVTQCCLSEATQVSVGNPPTATGFVVDPSQPEQVAPQLQQHLENQIECILAAPRTPYDTFIKT